jgi:hypothetical protein
MASGSFTRYLSKPTCLCGKSWNGGISNQVISFFRGTSELKNFIVYRPTPFNTGILNKCGKLGTTACVETNMRMEIGYT